MNSRILGTVLFALINLAIQAQNLDSLKRVVTITKSDINKATLFADISEIETQTDSILYYADKAIAFGEKTNNSIALAKAYISKGRGYNKLNRRDSAKYFIKRGLSLTPNNSKIQSYGFSFLGYTFHSDYKLDSAEYYYKKAINRKEIHVNSMGLAYRNLTQIYNARANPEEAKKSIRKAIELYKSIDNKQRIASSYSLLSQTYRRANNYDQAIAALDTAEYNVKKGSITHASILSEKGVILAKNSDPKTALQYYKKAFNIIIKKDKTPTERTISILYRIASVNFELKNYNESLKYIEQAKNYINSSDFWKAYFMHLKAYTFNAQNKQDSAISHYKKSNAYFKKANINHSVAETHYELGTIYSNRKQFEKGRKEFSLALEVAEKYNLQDIKQKSNSALFQLNEYNGNYKEALKYHKKYIAYKDSIQELNKNNAINEFQIKYETEKKENDILTLEKENAQKDMALQKEKQFYIILISVIASIFVIFFSFFYFNRKKKNLQNIQLALELKTQKEIAHIKNTFLENLSHEIRTPISVINGYLHLIKQNNLFPSKILQFSELASKSSDVIINNLNSLLLL